jgi:molecular chaperone DnaJ
MDFYAALGVPKKATAADIRKAYMVLCKTKHPDKGGDVEEFKKIQKAYETLSDDEKRAFYDQTGRSPDDVPGGTATATGPPQGFPFPFNMADIFDMFGPGGPGRRPRGIKPPPKVERIGVSLSQFYHGHQLEIIIDRLRKCDTCRGTGATSKESCGGCAGSGARSQVVHMGGMTMHTTGPCHTCKGSGQISKDSCATCSGQGRTQEKRKLDVRITAGMNPGDHLVFEGACSDIPEFEHAGDVHLILEAADDLNGWRRNGADLEKTVQLTLGQSLVGCTIRVMGHPRVPDGLWIKIPSGVVSGDVLLLRGDGMRKRSDSSGGRGDMKIHVQVVPLEEERQALRREGRDFLASLLNVRTAVVPDGQECVEPILPATEIPTPPASP